MEEILKSTELWDFIAGLISEKVKIKARLNYMEVDQLKAISSFKLKKCLRGSNSEFYSIQSSCVSVCTPLFPSILFCNSGIKHLYRLKESNPDN